MALSRRRFLAGLGAATFAAPRLLAEIKPPDAAVRPCIWVEDLVPHTIAIVGDIERTSIAQRSLIGRQQHDNERASILTAIAADRPDMLLMLGDQVLRGDDDSEWEYFDSIMKGVNDARIPVRSILGQHDYGLSTSRCLKNYRDRFPHCNPLHSLVRLGPIALVTLNSNFRQLSADQILKQDEDYLKWLGELDADPKIRGTIVASHHPPYTNSDLGRNPEVEEHFALPFLKSTKTRMFLSGNVHSYERFATGDKTFLISGGGGAPRRLIDNSSLRPFQNDAYRRGRLRPFHYIRLRVEENVLAGDVMMWQKKKFVVGDRFAIDL